MRERMPCEFFLVRYVPDAVKGEFVNIGVVLRAVGELPEAVGTVRFTRDWARVRCIDAGADLEMLEALEQEIASLLASQPIQNSAGILDQMQDSLSNAVQITPSRACLAESLPAELDQLMRLYVEPLKVARVRTQTGRAGIAGRIRTEFERAGVWGALSKRIPAARYTSPGDPLKLHCGYRAATAAAIRMFHAVSLAGDVEAAKSLAFSASPLREGVRRIEGTELELTAVIESLRSGPEQDDEASERYRFGVETMERQAIRVVTVNDLARAAETARRELGM